MRLQLEGQVEDLAAKLKDVDAENSQLKVGQDYFLLCTCSTNLHLSCFCLYWNMRTAVLKAVLLGRRRLLISGGSAVTLKTSSWSRLPS